MLFFNDEPFIRLKTAARCLSSYTCNLGNIDRLTENIADNLTIYERVFDICELNSHDKNTVTKAIDGVCEIEALTRTYTPIDNWNRHENTYTIFNLIYCKYSSPYKEKYNGYYVSPINDDPNTNYYNNAFVNLHDFIKYAKEISIKIDSPFLKEIILDDNNFNNAVRLKGAARINQKQIASRYYSYLPSILNETIDESVQAAVEKLGIVDKLKTTKDSYLSKNASNNENQLELDKLPLELKLTIDAYFNFWANNSTKNHTKQPPSKDGGLKNCGLKVQRFG